MGDYLDEVNLGVGMSAISLHLGEERSCALLDDGKMKCWGDYSFGQLGNGNIIEAIGDDNGEMGNYLLSVNMESGLEMIDCYDYNPTISPSLPSPTTSPIFVPTSLPTLKPSLPPVPTYPFKCKSDFTALSSSCVLLSTFQIKCWGSNA